MKVRIYFNSFTPQRFINHDNVFIYDFSIFLNSDQAEDSFRYLEQANNKSEWLCRAFFIYIVVGFAVSTAATSFFSVVVCFLINERFEAKSVQHPFKLM